MNLQNKDVKIVGFDLTEEASSGITDGTILAMIQQQPKEMGRLAVEAVVKAIKGKGRKEYTSTSFTL